MARVGVLLACSGAYGWWVGTTTAFTTRADVAVAVGFGAMALVAAGSRWGAGLRGPARGAGTGIIRSGSAGTTVAPGGGLGARRWAPWLVAIGLTAALELATYLAGFSGGRHAFPTLSSLADAAERSTGGKAALAWLWLALGWGLFRR